MKKLIIILAFISASCTKEDNDCKCDAKYVNYGGGSGYYTIPNTKINCDTRQPLKPNNNPNAVFIGCK